MTEKPTGKSGQLNVLVDFDGGFYHVFYDKGGRSDIDTARGCVKLFKELGGGKVMPLLVDMREVRSQTKESRDFFATDRELLSHFTAVALLVGSPLTKIISNFYMGINKPIIPTRMFDDRQKALDWLEQTKKDVE